MHEESIFLYNERIALAAVSGSDCKWLLEKTVSGKKNMVGMATWTHSCGVSHSSLSILVLNSWTPWNPTTRKGRLNHFQRNGLIFLTCVWTMKWSSGVLMIFWAQFGTPESHWFRLLSEWRVPFHAKGQEAFLCSGWGESSQKMLSNIKLKKWIHSLNP